MKQEGNVVTADVQVSLINVSHVRQRIQVLQLRAISRVCDPAIFPIRNSQNVFESFALGKLFYGVIKFLADHEIDGRAFPQTLLRLNRHMRTHERNLDVRICILDALDELNVSREARCAGVENQKLISLRNIDGLVRRNIMGRCVKQPGTFQHSRRISQPNRIPIRLNLAGCGPARACAAIKIFKRGRVKKQRF